MYKTGDLRTATDRKEIRDARSDDDLELVPNGTVYLPHSCDEWIVGGKAEVVRLIEDLQALVPELK